jgi:hypothetical protein
MVIDLKCLLNPLNWPILLCKLLFKKKKKEEKEEEFTFDYERIGQDKTKITIINNKTGKQFTRFVKTVPYKKNQLDFENIQL